MIEPQDDAQNTARRGRSCRDHVGRKEIPFRSSTPISICMTRLGRRARRIPSLRMHRRSYRATFASRQNRSGSSAASRSKPARGSRIIFGF